MAACLVACGLYTAGNGLGPHAARARLALLPKAVSRLTVAAGAAAGELQLDVRALDDPGQPLNAALPLEATVAEPKGKQGLRLFRSTEGADSL